MEPITALQQAEKLVASRHEPDGHEHPPEWTDQYISGSAIVKMTAREYAKKLLEQKAGVEEEDDIEMFWTFKGDTIAGESFSRDDGWVDEVRIAIPIDGERSDASWFIYIHPDAVRVIDDWVVLGEHKAFVMDNEEKRELARRQAMLALAGLTYQAETVLGGAEPWGGVEMMREGEVAFPRASWCDDQRPFIWRRDYRPAGVIRVIVDETPPPLRDVTETSYEMLQEVFDWYRAKARIILRAAWENDLSIAEKWDKGRGQTELARSIVEDLFEPAKENVEELVAAYDDVRGRIKTYEREKARIQAEILRTAEEEHLGKRFETDRFRVTVVQQSGRRYADVKALERDGLDEYVRTSDPYEYPLVKAKKEGAE